MRKPRGYIAIDRGIFEHPVFRNRPDWLRAWQWLIAEAAWKPQGARLSFGIAHLERGQLATTVRNLGMTWGWSKSNVSYFLGRLEAETMIVREQIRTKSRTRSGTTNSLTATLITICNYDKFQNAPRVAAAEVGQEVGQELGQEQRQLPGIVPESAPNHLNQSTKENIEEAVNCGEKRPARRRLEHCPPDGATTAKLLFARVGGQYWDSYANDYREVMGAEPMQTRYDDGFSGRWFARNGQRTAPQARHHRIAGGGR